MVSGAVENRRFYEETTFSKPPGCLKTTNFTTSNPNTLPQSQIPNTKFTKSSINNLNNVQSSQHFHETDNPENRARYFTPQPVRKTYSEQLDQVKAETIRNHLVLLTDNEQLNDETVTSQTQPTNYALATNQRRFSLATTNFEVDYRRSHEVHSNSSPGFFGGMLNCLRPVWAMVGRKSHTSIQARNRAIGNIEMESISGMTFVTSGAQGVVYSGWLQNRQVAVKRLRTRIEIDIIKTNMLSVRHPNIVEILGVCWHPFAIVMEYCAVGPLYRLLRNQSVEVSPMLIIEWARQIASAMQYLHQRKIVHRDLKSPNCLIGEQNQIKLIDFGNSKQLSGDNSHEHMSFSGTFAWMAPEVIRNEKCNERVDVWSYGVVLWELVTRQVPYCGVDSSAIIWGVGSNRLSLPIPNTTPPPLKMLLNQCWRQNYKERPSFAQILLHIDIWAVDFVQTPYQTLVDKQASWRGELKEAFERINKEGGGILELQRMDNEIVNQHRNELKQAQDVRTCYEEKLTRANTLMTELQTVLVELEHREQILKKKEKEVESILKLKKTTKSSIAQLDKLMQQQAQATREKSPVKVSPEVTSQTLNDIHRRRCHTVNNNLRETDESPKNRLFPKMTASTLWNLNLTPTRTRARKSLRINMFKREQQRASMTTSSKSEKPSRRTRSLDPSSPLVNNHQYLNNQQNLNQSQTSSMLTSSMSSAAYHHQKSSSLVGSAKQQITRKASNTLLVNHSDQSLASELDEGCYHNRTSCYKQSCRSRHLSSCSNKDMALANWSHTVRNAFLSTSLDRSKFTNLKQNLNENRLRRISRSLSNLQQELDEEIAECSRRTESTKSSANRLFDKSICQPMRKEDNSDYKNNLFREARGNSGKLDSELKPARQDCCCACNCHDATSSQSHRRRTTSANYHDISHNAVVSPVSSRSASTFNKIKDSDQASLTESAPFSSEEDILDPDCASDDLAEKELAVKQFLEKITSELSSNSVLTQKSTEYLY